MTPEEYLTAIEPLFYKDGKLIPLEVATLGLVGELGELFSVPEGQEKIDELGDVVWYHGATAYVLAGSGQPLPEPTSAFVPNAVGEVCEAVKKYVWHGKQINGQEFSNALSSVLAQALIFVSDREAPQAEDFAALMSRAAEANVAKLRKRYPNGFVEGGGVR